MGAAGGTQRLEFRWRDSVALGRWQVTTSGALLAGLDGSGAAHRTRRLVCHWQYVTLACIVAHRK